MIGLRTRDNTGGGKGPRGRGCSGGFTLVELLVVIVVIGILSGMVLGALNAASQTTKVSKTRSTIEKLHRVIMRKYQEYRTRRLPITIPAGMQPSAVAQIKLNALRDLMRMEMPDRWSDVVESVADDVPSVPGMERPALSQRYLRAFNQAMAAAGSDTDKQNAVITFAAAECLYMIVMNSPEDAELFQSNEIGDYDGDGLSEFHDAWGHPIRFVRWPTGFLNDSDFQTDDAATSPDPFDTLNVDQRIRGINNYMLIPLIYSAGPDGVFDINLGAPQTSPRTAQDGVYSYSIGYDADGCMNVHVTDGDGNMIGQPFDGDAIDGSPPNNSLDHLDNIHNHRREGR